LGFFGTKGFSTDEGLTQNFKIPHLRNAYEKVGMFGLPAIAGILGGDNGHTGEQIRGFGFLHDGSVDTVRRFLRAIQFIFPDGEAGEEQRRHLEQFVLAFDTELKPVVGQQVTLDGTNGAVVGPQIDLLVGRCGAGDCELIAKGVVAGAPRGVLLRADGMFETDKTGEAAVSLAELMGWAAVPGQELTFTAGPVPGGAWGSTATRTGCSTPMPSLRPNLRGQQWPSAREGPRSMATTGRGDRHLSPVLMHHRYEGGRCMLLPACLRSAPLGLCSLVAVFALVSPLLPLSGSPLLALFRAVVVS
jgi:hypothetical protein